MYERYLIGDSNAIPISDNREKSNSGWSSYLVASGLSGAMSGASKLFVRYIQLVPTLKANRVSLILEDQSWPHSAVSANIPTILDIPHTARATWDDTITSTSMHRT
jgi:hypothetical protein